MTRKAHDQFAKQYLKGLLIAFSVEAEISLEIPPGEPQQVDLWCQPNPQLATQQHHLGLLGQMLQAPALLEAFRNPAPPLRFAPASINYCGSRPTNAAQLNAKNKNGWTPTSPTSGSWSLRLLPASSLASGRNPNRAGPRVSTS